MKKKRDRALDIFYQQKRNIKYRIAFCERQERKYIREIKAATSSLVSWQRTKRSWQQALRMYEREEL